MRLRWPLLMIVFAACSEPGQTEVARGNVLASRGQLSEATESYRAAALAAPGRARPRELWGHVLFDQGLFAEARQAYEEAVRLEPSASVEARVGLARIEAQAGRLAEAIEALSGLLEQSPNNLYARLSRATLAMRRAGAKDAELALLDTAEAMRLDPKGASVLYARGCAFLAAQKPTRAIEAFELLEKAHPSSPLAAYGRARVAAAAQKRADVVLHLRQARSLAGTAAWKPAEILADPAFTFMKEDPEFLAELTGS